MLPNPTREHNYLIIEVNLKYTKDYHLKPKTKKVRYIVYNSKSLELNTPLRKIFLISKVKEPVFNIIDYFLLLVILNDTFESDFILSTEDIFKIRVEPLQQLLR